MRGGDVSEWFAGSTFDRLTMERSPAIGMWEKASSGKTVECIDEDLLIRFYETGNKIGRIRDSYHDVRTSMMELGLMSDDGTVCMAGYYLFSRDRPLGIKLGIFDTDECLTLSENIWFQGNILECIDEAIGYIRDRMEWNMELNGSVKVNVPEVPMDAVREIVTNSFCHMRYRTGSLYLIYLTPSIIRVANPGGFPAGTTPETFATRRRSAMIRNL